MPGADPVTLVTGSRKGIGRALVEHFLARGHRVVGCSRGASDLRHERYLHCEADVASEGDARIVFKEIADRFGRLDNLVNNAGVASMNHFLLTPTATMRAVVETNLIGTMLYCREGARIMQKHRHGRIVNFSTVAVPLCLEGEAVYAASKAGVESLTRVLAREFAPFGITVNAVGPAPIETDLIRGVPRRKLDGLLDRQAIRRTGTMAELSAVVDFFLADDGGFVTGQVIYMGGVS